ncbi:MAG TPA: TolC family protein [Anaeromyxobacter sp.]|nr:TolC family protein [Anaeromyxobacter sp.]
MTPHASARRGARHPSGRPLLVLAALAVAGPARAADSLSLEDAIRAAWSRHLGLAAGAAQVEAARADAAAATASLLPALQLSARGVRTDEPLTAFGIKLDQGRITAADFDPARLNDPDAITGLGGGVTLTQPIFAGGRILAGRRALRASAAAEAASQQRRSQEVAVAVVEAYFGAGVAGEGLRFADDLLAQARETERFVALRNKEGLALDADVARATAFRAQAEADRAAAAQRLESARSALVLLVSDDAAGAALASPIEAAGAPVAAGGVERPDLAAARLRRDAAEAGVAAARGSLLPEVGAQASLETLRTSDLDDGASWFGVGVVAKWQLTVADGARLRAARARARAAEAALGWQARAAAREAAEARRAVETADARVRSAHEAVAASESARSLRAARHRQGLTPLTDLLDAEAGLAGARALLLASRLDARVARARLALADGSPVEGLQP